jgi:acylglycerol lipase
MPSMELSQRLAFTVNVLDFLELFLPIEFKLFKGRLENSINNPQVIEDTKADELYLKQRVKLRTISTLFYAMEKAQSSLSQYDCPFMVIQGGLDKLVSPEVAFELFSKSKTAEKDK